MQHGTEDDTSMVILVSMVRMIRPLRELIVAVCLQCDYVPGGDKQGRGVTAVVVRSMDVTIVVVAVLRVRIRLT